MSITRRSNVVKTGFPFTRRTNETCHILVTGFYDWVTPKGLPAGANNTTDLNPSGHLLKGKYPGHLTHLLKGIKTSRNSCPIEWSFQCVRVSETEALALDYKDYHIIISLGLGNDTDDSVLILEDGALNRFEGSDVDDLTTSHGLAKNAERNTTRALKIVRSIPSSLGILNQMELTRIDPMGLASKNFRELKTYIVDAQAKVGNALNVTQQFKSTMERDLASDAVTLDESMAVRAVNSCNDAQQKLLNSVSAASQLFDQTPISQEHSALANSFCTGVGSIKNDLEKALDLMNKAGIDCAMASGCIKAGLTSHALDKNQGIDYTLQTPAIPPQILKNQGLPSKKYGEYTMRRDRPDPGNSYTCNALHYHLLQIINNRITLGARLSEAYFIHLPYAKKSLGWQKTFKEYSENNNKQKAIDYDKIKTKVSNEAEGYTLLAKAVFELIKAIVT